MSTMGVPATRLPLTWRSSGKHAIVHADKKLTALLKLGAGAFAALLENRPGLAAIWRESVFLSRNQLRKVNGSRIRTTTGWPCLRAGANCQFCTAYIASAANE
jgi:hypothetical protein